MSDFDDIRPYRDNEVAAVVAELVQDPEMHSAIAQFKFTKLHAWLPSLTKSLTAWYIKRLTRNINSVKDLQNILEGYLTHMINSSTQGVSVSGLEHLDLSQPALFISNHRDIVLDPALVNLALHQNGSDTLSIAIGDNLLTKPWVSDLMRLNKSFLVKRSAKSKREMLTNSKQLSAYIKHCIDAEKSHVWIAQREGRAKDGLDVTNPAIISMLLLNKVKTDDLSQYIKQLNIVPVAISYELDPCDISKAKELEQIERTGSYQKGEQEDVASITTGITGYKGQVHVAFGQPLNGSWQDSKQVAQAIDAQIIDLYQAFASNEKAQQAIQAQQLDVAHPQLQKRLEQLNPAQKKWLLAMYANPVAAKKA